MRALLRAASIGALVLCTILGASSAGAAEDDLSRAVDHYKAQRYGPAAEGFLREHERTGKPWLLFNIAECFRGLYNQTLELPALSRARGYYMRYLDADPRGKKAQQAREQLAEVEQELRRRGQDPAAAVANAAPKPEPAAPQAAPKLGPPPALRPPDARPAPALLPPASTLSEDVPVYRRTWFWVAGGAVLAGAATTLWLVTRPARVDAPGPGEFPAMPFER